MDDFTPEPRDSIKFTEIRDVGSVFGTTFDFVRQEAKEYIKTQIFLAGPFYIVGSIVLGAAIVFGVFNMVNSGFAGAAALQNLGANPDPLAAMQAVSAFFGQLFAEFFVWLLPGTLLLMLSAYISYVSGMQYLRLYVTHGRDTFTWREVLVEVKADRGRQLGVLIVDSIFRTVGFFLCFFPMLYLWVPMAFMKADRIFRPEVGFGENFSEGFRLTKDRWWVSFLSLFVVFLGFLGIYIGVSLVFELISYVFSVGAEDGNVALGAGWVAISIISLVVNAIISLILYMAMQTAEVLTYFSAREHHGAESLYEEVDNMGFGLDDDAGGAFDPRAYSADPGAANPEPDDPSTESTSWQRPAPGDIKWTNPPGTSDASSAEPPADSDADKWAPPTGTPPNDPPNDPPGPNHGASQDDATDNTGTGPDDPDKQGPK